MGKAKNPLNRAWSMIITDVLVNPHIIIPKYELYFAIEWFVLIVKLSNEKLKEDTNLFNGKKIGSFPCPYVQRPSTSTASNN